MADDNKDGSSSNGKGGVNPEELDAALSMEEDLQALFASILSPATMSALSNASMSERLGQFAQLEKAVQDGEGPLGFDEENEDLAPLPSQRNGGKNEFGEDDIDDEDDEDLSEVLLESDLNELSSLEQDLDRIDNVLNVMERNSSALQLKLQDFLLAMRQSRSEDTNGQGADDAAAAAGDSAAVTDEAKPVVVQQEQPAEAAGIAAANVTEAAMAATTSTENSNGASRAVVADSASSS